MGLVSLNIEQENIYRSSVYWVGCNALWDHVTTVNSYCFSEATYSALLNPGHKGCARRLWKTLGCNMCTAMPDNRGSVSISGYLIKNQIKHYNLRFAAWMTVSLWNLASDSAAVLPNHLAIFRVFTKSLTQMPWLWLFVRFDERTSDQIWKQAQALTNHVDTNILHRQWTHDTNCSVGGGRYYISKHWWVFNDYGHLIQKWKTFKFIHIFFFIKVLVKG